MTQPLLEVEGLDVSFRAGGLLARLQHGRGGLRLDAVLGVDLQFGRGETLAIVGESGSGKTTLARAIARLIPLRGGRIRFEGRDVTRARGAELRALRRRIAVMFQDPVSSLSPRRSVRAQLVEPFAIHGLPLRDPTGRAAELLDMVGLSPRLLASYPHQLSGGQARRVGVARALALEPALVIADEPTAGLDVSVQGELLNLLGELQARLGLSFLVVSHNLPVVRHVSDRLAIMYLGRIVEEGPTAAVFGAPAHPYTRALVEATPVPDPHRRRTRYPLLGEVPSIMNRPPGCAFHQRCPVATPRCAVEEPVATPLGGGRRVRCLTPLVGKGMAA